MPGADIQVRNGKFERAGATLRLEASGLDAGYGGQAVARDVNLSVSAGEIVCLLGANGAGKSAVLQTLAGILPAIAGQVSLFGRVTTAPLHQRARAGLAYIGDERSVIHGLSVRDNLLLGGGSISRALQVFPELAALLERPAGRLSGGEQQLLALARSLARTPLLLIVDELSMGLAPRIVQRLLGVLKQAAANGLAVLLVEQQLATALQYADRGYIMSRGRIVMADTAAGIWRQRERVAQTYLSLASDSVQGASI